MCGWSEASIELMLAWPWPSPSSWVGAGGGEFELKFDEMGLRSPFMGYSTELTRCRLDSRWNDSSPKTLNGLVKFLELSLDSITQWKSFGLLTGKDIRVLCLHRLIMASVTCIASKSIRTSFLADRSLMLMLLRTERLASEDSFQWDSRFSYNSRASLFLLTCAVPHYLL